MSLGSYQTPTLTFGGVPTTGSGSVPLSFGTPVYDDGPLRAARQIPPPAPIYDDAIMRAARQVSPTTPVPQPIQTVWPTAPATPGLLWDFTSGLLDFGTGVTNSGPHSAVTPFNPAAGVTAPTGGVISGPPSGIQTVPVQADGKNWLLSSIKNLAGSVLSNMGAATDELIPVMGSGQQAQPQSNSMGMVLILGAGVAAYLALKN